MLFRAVVLVTAVLLLGGCAGEPFDYHHPQEIKSGPGLFSGEDGVFTIFRR